MEVETLCLQVQRLIEESMERQRLTAIAPVDETWGEDEEAEVEQLRNDNQVLRIRYADLVGVIMEIYRLQFLQCSMEKFVPIVQQCFAQGASVLDRYLGLYLQGVSLEKLGADGA